MKEKISISLSNPRTNAEHDAFVDSNRPNMFCPLDSFLHKLLNFTHGAPLTNDLRALPVITYSVNGKYVAWFDTSEDQGFV
ncbi:MAG: hypothetical protein ABWX90_03580 [Candidatus Saccharimonadales bacterium]